MVSDRIVKAMPYYTQLNLFSRPAKNTLIYAQIECGVRMPKHKAMAVGGSTSASVRFQVWQLNPRPHVGFCGE